jgi:hypothetical protein
MKQQMFLIMWPVFVFWTLWKVERGQNISEKKKLLEQVGKCQLYKWDNAICHSVNDRERKMCLI